MSCSYFDNVAWIYPLVQVLNIHKKFYNTIRNLAKLNNNMKVLDVGGGTGIIANLLVNHVKEITVLDPSKKMLEKIKSKRIKKIQGEAKDLLFKKNSFDLVYCVDSLHHFTNGSKEKREVLKESLQELLRVLKPKGHLILLEFNPKSKIGKRIEWFENKIMKWGSTFLTPQELQTLLEEQNVKAAYNKIDSYSYAMHVRK